MPIRSTRSTLNAKKLSTAISLTALSRFQNLICRKQGWILKTSRTPFSSVRLILFYKKLYVLLALCHRVFVAGTVIGAAELRILKDTGHLVLVEILAAGILVVLFVVVVIPAGLALEHGKRLLSSSSADCFLFLFYHNPRKRKAGFTKSLQTPLAKSGRRCIIVLALGN